MQRWAEPFAERKLWSLVSGRGLTPENPCKTTTKLRHDPQDMKDNIDSCEDITEPTWQHGEDLRRTSSV